MKQWIRWSGLAGFVVVFGLIVAFFMLAAGPLIKSSIEYFGSELAGAKVSVDDVSLQFSPFGIELQQLQVADADKPMENLLQFDQAVAELELAPLLLGKSIVRELSVDNLQFNTPRTESGALEKVAEEEAVDEEAETQAEEPSIAKLPSVDEILARESLKTEQAGRDVQQAFESRKQQVEQATAAVPDAEALARYQRELEVLTSGDIKSLEDFNQRKKKFDQLKKQFKQDKKAVVAAKQAISDARRDLSEKLSALKAAPGQDLESIQNKYQFNASGATNVSALLFGEEAGQWAEKTLYWYEKIKPYLASDGSESGEAEVEEIEPQRGTGRFIHFPSNDPWPEFLIRKAHLSAPMLGGQMLIEATDVTHQQAVLGRPTLVVIQGEALTDIQGLAIEATLDHRQAPGKDSVTLDMKDWNLKGVNLGVAGAEIESALVQVQGLALVSGDQLQAKADAQLGQTQFAGQGKTQFAKEMLRALASIDQFTIESSATGELTSPEVKFGSDLDRKLNKAFKQRLKKKQGELEAKLQSRLDDKMQSYLGDYADDLKALNQLDGSLDDKTEQLTQMAEKQLDDYQAQQKAKADKELKKQEKELENKLNDKLKSFF
ncbi:TIGR03545 family protein [Bacterioplanoides sp. SCSIO 12839]|uniref:TIGR03545 family protein n=1 Tax=Bacterioplanoides sp. SCSIO 12839 TaxID=2829569 RepID=UPI002103A1DA|nr:TIGR03545 family protein [Bacterioplanoides sp. SCSIO 12839]UTW47339.1 TIGR03545 family protein [Bacterioplanoides sp. SCSIO 12839]